MLYCALLCFTVLHGSSPCRKSKSNQLTTTYDHWPLDYRRSSLRKLQLFKSFSNSLRKLQYPIPTEPETPIPNTHRVQNSNTQYPSIGATKLCFSPVLYCAVLCCTVPARVMSHEANANPCKVLDISVEGVDLMQLANKRCISLVVYSQGIKTVRVNCLMSCSRPFILIFGIM